MRQLLACLLLTACSSTVAEKGDPESRAVVHDRLTGEKSLPIEHLLVLPRRQHDQLLALLADVGDAATAA